MATEQNPYESPNADSGDVTKQPTMMIWSVAIVFACALIGGLIGLCIGAALGSYLPRYYRSVFSGGQSPDFDPVAVGIGQGLTQGIGGGGVVGILLVALFYWHRGRGGSARRSNSKATLHDEGGLQRQREA